MNQPSLSTPPGGSARTAVLQLVDSLALGGAERVAVNLANDLPRDRYAPLLCATRSTGPLASLVQADVQLLALGKRHTFDIQKTWNLLSYLKTHNVQVVHAHSTSLFMASVLRVLRPSLKVVWHDHFGACSPGSRPRRLYKVAVSNVHAIVAVSQAIVDWAVEVLGFPEAKVQLIHNYVATNRESRADIAVGGRGGSRVVCVAQLRPQKDHKTLLEAFRLVVDQRNEAQLIIVGATPDTTYDNFLKSKADQLGLSEHVTFLGERSDVGSILSNCDIGVLSSTWEGLPLSLLEYGSYGLPVVATSVGECGEVLDRGRCGVLVQPSQPKQLGQALVRLLASPDLGKKLGSALRERVQANFSREAAIRKLCAVYERL